MSSWPCFCGTDGGTEPWSLWMAWPKPHHWWNSDSTPSSLSVQPYSRLLHTLETITPRTTTLTHQPLTMVPIPFSPVTSVTQQKCKSKWYGLAVTVRRAQECFLNIPRRNVSVMFCMEHLPRWPPGFLPQPLSSLFSVTSSERLSLTTYPTQNSPPSLHDCFWEHLSLPGIAYVWVFADDLPSPLECNLHERSLILFTPQAPVPWKHLAQSICLEYLVGKKQINLWVTEKLLLYIFIFSLSCNFQIFSSKIVSFFYNM